MLLLLIIKLKLEPFIALFVVGVARRARRGRARRRTGRHADSAADSLLEKGFGGILGHITPIIGLGTVLGAIMERSGGADVLTKRLLRLFGPKGAPLAMGLTGLILGIPVFFDIGIFVLAPLVYVAAKRGGKSLVLYAMPMLAGLSMTHAFLPPHPGPVAAAGLLSVDLGWIIIMGLVCGIPAWLVAGVWWGSLSASGCSSRCRTSSSPPSRKRTGVTTADTGDGDRRRPGPGPAAPRPPVRTQPPPSA